jgi:hypothetical protein
VFFEVVDSEAQVDPITKSRFNLQIGSAVMNMAELLVLNGIPPRDQGIATPYVAQVMVYKYAANQLHLVYPTKGHNRLLIGTANSMEGEESSIMQTDSHDVLYHDLYATTRYVMNVREQSPEQPTPL